MRIAQELSPMRQPSAKVGGKLHSLGWFDPAVESSRQLESMLNCALAMLHYIQFMLLAASLPSKRKVTLKGPGCAGHAELLLSMPHSTTRKDPTAKPANMNTAPGTAQSREPLSRAALPRREAGRPPNSKNSP